MGEITLERLRRALTEDAAIRRVQRLLPAGGRGDKVFPPTYPGIGRNTSARHIFETRRVDGLDVRCVVIDSVQSQANRLEEALLAALREGRIQVPHLVVDFKGQIDNGTDVGDIGEITSLEAPHRVFDAIIRDSQLDGTKFTDTKEYKELLLAKPTNALALFKLSPTSLVFGVWNSFGQGGGLGAKFARCLISEIVGVGANEGTRAAVRIDPLGIRRSVEVVGGRLDWKVAQADAKGPKTKPSDLGHGNIIASAEVPGGTTIDYALHTAVISCAGLRRLRFPGTRDDTAGRAVLASLALSALTEQDRAGYALRSRCDLVADGHAPFEFVHSDGATESFSFEAEGAGRLLTEAVKAAEETGFLWPAKPVRLVPQARLVKLVARSRAKALVGEADDTDPDA